MIQIKNFLKRLNFNQYITKYYVVTLIDFPENINGGSIKYAILLNNGISKTHKNNFLIRPKIYHKGLFSNFSKIFNLLIYLLKVLKLNIFNNNSIFISHHPVSAFFLLILDCKSVFYVCHGPWADEYRDINQKMILGRLNFKIRELIQSFVLENSHKLFFVSNYMYRCMDKKFNEVLRKRKGKILGPINDDKQIIQSISSNRTNAVIIRRLVKRTGVLDLLIKLQDRKLILDLDIIGEGNQINQIRRLAKSSLSKVIVKGSLRESKKNRILSERIACIVPSLSMEGFGLVILEAISFGCIPIVSNNAGGGKDWLNQFDSNLIYDGSINDLNRAIKYVEENYLSIIEILKNELSKFNPEKVSSKLFK